MDMAGGCEGLMGMTEEGRPVWWGWMEWQRAMEGRQRQEKVWTVDIMLCSEWWTCKACGHVGRRTAGCEDCVHAVRSIVDE